MKKIQFKSISVQNFLSVGDKKIEIDFIKGLNLITGENLDNNTRNGVGKSSIIESIYWCLFGNTIRDIKNDKIIHNLSKKNCEVVLKFDIKNANNETTSFEVNRKLNPSKISIFKNGENVTLSTIPANDDFIKKLIGGTEELFNNSVILTANNTMPFMAQKKIDKRKFLESVFNLNIFSELLLKSRSEYNELKKENDILCNSFLNEQKNLEIFEEQVKKQKKIKEEKIKQIENLISETQKQIDVIKNTSLDLETIKKTIKSLNDKLLNLESLLEITENTIINYNNTKTELKFKIEQLNKERELLLKKKEICPVCNRKYSNEEISIVEDNIDKIKTNLKDFISENQKIVESLQKEIEKKEEFKKSLISIREEIKKNIDIKTSEELKEEKIKTLESKIQEYKKSIIELKEEKILSQEEIEKTNKKIKELEKKLKNIKEELFILDSVKFVLSEEGVKTFIIKKMLDVLNDKLNFYLKKLNAPCTCTFDEQFEETIKNVNGKECSYFNFSGGERKRIDVAILFMFQDILRYYSGTYFSLSMYDELFDSALDESGIDNILEILKKRIEDYDESVYIVSHNKSATKNTFDTVILLQKENGQTILTT
jgi:DNA repair exonuclease SbcCD ATPase subunit